MPRDPLQDRIDALEDEIADLRTGQGKISRRLERLYSDGASAGLSREDVDGLLNDRLAELASELTAEDDGEDSPADDAQARKNKAAARHIRQREGRKAEQRKSESGKQDEDADGDEDEGDDAADETEDEHEHQSAPPEPDSQPHGEEGPLSRPLKITHGFW